MVDCQFDPYLRAYQGLHTNLNSTKLCWLRKMLILMPKVDKLPYVTAGGNQTVYHAESRVRFAVHDIARETNIFPSVHLHVKQLW